MSTLKDWLKDLVCTGCQATNTIRPIHYGLLGLPSDVRELLIIEKRNGPLDHTHGCKECGWEGDFVDGILINPPLTLDEVLTEHIESIMEFTAENPHISQDSELRKSFIETALAQLQIKLATLSDWEFHK